MRIGVFSTEFEGGGAERVLSLLINNEEVKGFAFSSSIQYIADSSKHKVVAMTASKNRIFRWLQKSCFLIVNFQKNEIAIFSDFFLLFFASILKIFHNNVTIIYRPSIDFHYLENMMSRKLPYSTSKKIFQFVANQSHFVFQTNAIKLSFNTRLNIQNKQLTLYNPISRVNWTGDQIRKIHNLSFVFIGRPTFEKGYDRYIEFTEALIRSEIFSKFSFLQLGAKPEKSYFAKHIKNLGFCNPADTGLNGTFVIVSSRLEGFPNIILELLNSKIRPIVSIEVAQYFNEFPEIQNFLISLDFDSNITTTQIESKLRHKSTTLNDSELTTFRNTFLTETSYAQKFISFCYLVRTYETHQIKS